MADTSFSDPRRGVVDTRGCAVSSIHIHNPTWTPDGNVGVSEASYVSEQYLLDLEREAFLSLCTERKTLERIQHMLKTGKPLRN